MAIGGVEPGRDRLLGLARGGSEHAEAEGRHLDPVVRCHRRNMLRRDHASAVVIPDRTRMGTNAILQG